MHARRPLAAAASAALLLTALAAAPAAAAPAPDSPAPSAAAPGQYRVTGPDTAEERTEVAATGVAIDEVGDGSVVVTALPGQADAVADLGHEVTPLPGPEQEGPSTLDFPPSDSGYHNYDELTEVVDEVVADNPDLAAKVSVGSSYEGRDLMAVKITSDVGTDHDRPEVLFTHSQHAREHLTVEMAVYLLRMFTEDYGTDPRVTEMVDTREIWILPNVNPDGSEHDIADGSYESWRKNRQPAPGGSAVGTDLNRNWDYNWGCCGGSSGSPSSQTYRGPSAESAPEVSQVADFVRSRVVGGEQQITAAIDFHTYGELVLWPYGYTYDETGPGMSRDEYDTHAELGRLMAGSNGYTPQQSSDLYITDGTINDWLWGDQRIFNYTFEMYPSGAGGGGFYPGDEIIDRETDRNREAVLDLLGYADCPYRVIDKEDQYC
ncbi:M14 family metallopeptidase [Nocardiopsis sp. RSe5-2]|uniref:M14 family metallopeptidase n=1 Tax=Nocardiopsis endophytica TaxID=3018445 RepID=A0ABT4TXJ4_9ACTN|nr:M14 family metallopeptidase [Nocardiopsis endophytica]MDA2809151.1 M14 family metallopeptidase [Nocardiopsis endophytica]